ncbi:uncharacterized protein LOC130558308 [Triplophysa rosa]|uniref:uncharacterized protein LOC130558308 n=1 Tax=Triplophysa rosa TaxID=992332 RepID=UPI0025460B6E|nr:uncharacterized protein LOC130558308 [Triplophysa rosa]
MASSESQTLCFISWNVCGRKTLNQSINTFAEKYGAKIFFIQETKIGPEDNNALENIKGWKCYYTVYNSKSKGVAVLIKDDAEFQYICHDEDYSGGYLVLFCYLYNALFTLVNIYNHKGDMDILNRLKDYLRDTAEGVLVVGGDFNTVLDLTFDRKSLAKNKCHTPLEGIFRNFNDNLRLRDTWGYVHPRKRSFTYSQKESYSRLDMFLLCEDYLEQINDLKIDKPERPGVDRKSTSTKTNISDHLLLILSLKIREQFCHKVPNVASWLVDHKYHVEQDRRAGKINGAEILSVIKSLTDSGQKSPDGIRVQTYKNLCCPLTEILKMYFNLWMKQKQLPKEFVSSISASNGRKCFNVDYLIFTMILAKRLNTLVKAMGKKEKKNKENNNMNDTCCIGFAVKPKEIKWAFLKKSLSYLLKACETNKCIHPRDFTVLEGLV